MSSLMKLETLIIHAACNVDKSTGAVISPIQLATTFERDEDGDYSKGYIYARHRNPGRAELEQCLAALEGGADAACFASGSAAAMSIFQSLSPGDHVIVPEDMYMGIRHQIREIMLRWKLEASFIDFRELEKHIRSNTRLIWIETPSNPLLTVTDIRHVADIARQHRIPTVCDNTFATPVFQRPLDLGIDYVMHSATKYLGGHSDVLGGAVICARENGLWEAIKENQHLGGGVLSPFDCFLTLRGIKTLACRMQVHHENALQLATWLSQHPSVENVYHPGLPGHPGHVIAARQMSGYSGIFSFLIKGGQKEAFTLINRCRIFTRATSLGGVESLIEHRASQEGEGTTAPPNLIRVSTGIEHIDDLIHDLEQAL